MANEASQLYQKLVKDHGMPECKTLMQLGDHWYETPEQDGGDPDEAISTAVFRIMQPAEYAQVMAKHSATWAKTFAGAAPTNADPVATLKQVIELATKRSK